MNEVETKRRAKPRQVQVGERFERLVAIEWFKLPNRPDRIWKCRCDCGNLTTERAAKLIGGEKKSCGCLMRERRKGSAWRKDGTIHGQSKSLAYSSWCHMKARCNNPNHESYPHYGGRGIVVCERWANSFAAFFEDMGDRPSRKHEIDRIDNDGNYEPGNCQWATRRQQSRNKRTNVFVNVDGDVRCVTDWANGLGVRGDTVKHRLSRGWDPAVAVTTPPGRPAVGPDGRFCPSPNSKGEQK
jgi:hypothetical protein